MGVWEYGSVKIRTLTLLLNMQKFRNSHTLILPYFPMLQPFENFRPYYLPRLIEMSRRYLVSQTYTRIKELDTDPLLAQINLLLSDYAELGEAKLHVNAVKKDRYAAIIDLKNPVHLKKIQEMLLAGSGYRIFFAVVRSAKELENLVNKNYKDKLKQWVEKQTNWRISHDAIIKPTIQLSFGELFVILKHRNQAIRVKFEEVEQI